MSKLFRRCTNTGRIKGLAKPKGLFTLLFLLIGFLSLIWFLIRVIPKPSRASYPCMKATMPLAYSFVAYLLSLGASVLFFRKAFSQLRQRKFAMFLLVFLGAGIFAGWALVNNSGTISANTEPMQYFNDPLGPNQPIGEAKGIFPGRVVWVWDVNATNENCTNNSHADAYWLAKNTNQQVVDKMLSAALKELTGATTDSEAWDSVFKYLNVKHDKGEVGYNESETIFIKINAVTAWSGAEPNGDMPNGLGIEFDTSPQTILAMLRQLVNNAGVPQEKIFIGDPMCDIFNTLYDLFYAEFPNINYVTQGNVSNRYKLKKSTEVGINYSDKGTVMTQITSHKFFEEMMDADYLLNIPTMKGHRWAGVTLFAKNHFGSNTVDHSWELHQGLMNPDNQGMRYGYKLYRVFVDLMASENLGGKTLLYYMDALWSTSYEHQKPQKFQSTPFNNDWSSSILLSLDPVAIESVCIDILQKEFKTEDLTQNPPRHTYVQWDGVDDYLHQAASSEWWPDSLIYDPDNTGNAIGSLGTHEHWNNEEDMQYSRNLATGEGIELVKIFNDEVSTLSSINGFERVDLFPNPCTAEITVGFEIAAPSNVHIQIFDMNGRLVKTIADQLSSLGYNEFKVDVNDLSTGSYVCMVELDNAMEAERISGVVVKR